MVGSHSRHQACTGRSAYRLLAIVVREHGAHFGQAVNVGCFDQFVSIATHDGLQVINRNKKNVWLLCLLGIEVSG